MVESCYRGKLWHRKRAAKDLTKKTKHPLLPYFMPVANFEVFFVGRIGGLGQ